MSITRRFLLRERLQRLVLEAGRDHRLDEALGERARRRGVELAR